MFTKGDRRLWGQSVKTIPETEVAVMRRDNRASKSPAGWLKNSNPSGDPSGAPRCGAKTRKGKKCLAPAMCNGRCPRDRRAWGQSVKTIPETEVAVMRRDNRAS